MFNYSYSKRNCVSELEETIHIGITYSYSRVFYSHCEGNFWHICLTFFHELHYLRHFPSAIARIKTHETFEIKSRAVSLASKGSPSGPFFRDRIIGILRSTTLGRGIPTGSSSESLFSRPLYGVGRQFREFLQLGRGGLNVEFFTNLLSSEYSKINFQKRPFSTQVNSLVEYKEIEHIKPNL